MKRAHVITAVVVSFGLTAACAPGDRREPVTEGVGTTFEDQDRRTDTTRDPATTQAMQMTVTGCVTEQNNQFMLTQLEPVTAVGRDAQAYHLVGETQQLRQHVGERVQVMGEARQDQTAFTAEPGAQPGAQAGAQPGAQPGAQAGARDTTPGADREPIGTTGEPGMTAADANTLRVTSITPVAGECPTPGGR